VTGSDSTVIRTDQSKVAGTVRVEEDAVQEVAFLVGIGATGLAIASVAVFGISTLIHVSVGTLALALVPGGVALGIVLSWLYLWWFVRAVVLTPSSVEFVHVTRSIIIPWSELSPSRGPLAHGSRGVNFASARRVPMVGRGFRTQTVSLAQARAIITYPSHPPWVVSESLRRRLRLG
jgi:hypothetical protein